MIAVSAKDPKDATTRDQIRLHLEHVAQAFSRGDFDIPMFVHDQVPPAAPEMKRLAGAIHYRFTETEEGGKVSISSGSLRARWPSAPSSPSRSGNTEPATRSPSGNEAGGCPPVFSSRSCTSVHVPMGRNPDRHPVSPRKRL